MQKKTAEPFTTATYGPHFCDGFFPLLLQTIQGWPISKQRTAGFQPTNDIVELFFDGWENDGYPARGVTVH